VPEALTRRVEIALDQFGRYLRDEIEPAGAADALATLMAQPPDVTMQQVASWTLEQASARPMPASDLLLEALKKVFVTGEMGLLDREAVAGFLDRATTIALRMCPVEERTLLRTNLAAMRTAREMVQRTESRPRLPTISGTMPIVVDEEAQTARRFSLIYDRLTRQMESGDAAAIDPQALSQLVTMTASRANTGQQFNEYLEQLKPLIGGKEGNVFVILGGGMPSWEIPNAPQGTWKPPAQVSAMEKIIDLAESPAVALQRFRELVNAAVGKFNEGSLAAAVWMFDVANDSITEKKLDTAEVDRIRAEAADAISSVQLRKYAETKRRAAALKLVLDFFPTFRIEKLFKNLRGEPRADRRRTLLGIIEAHGAAGRDAALAELEVEMHRSDVDTYYLRNLIFLLHRIPRESDDVARELDLLTQLSTRGNNIYVIKEAVTGLGQIKTDAVTQLLTMRLAEFEAILLRSDASQYPIAEMQKLLDRITQALARIGTPAALLTIARHGMKANPLLGDTRGRLAALAQHDLSFDDATVGVLLKALRDEIPGKLFGRLLPKKQDSTVRLIEALSGTKSDDAQELFREIAERFADQDVGRAAAQLVSANAPKSASSSSRIEVQAATFAGELEFFGLPSILQSLAEMRATGMLTLSTKEGRAVSKMVFVEGKFINAQTGHVRGTDAMYEALERPISGRFAFVPHPAERMQSPNAPLDIMPILLEGVRRHDELQAILAMIPDAMILAKGEARPGAHQEEKDPGLMREVWTKASAGTAVIECERQIAADSYRVRRLIAHWLEQGALVGAV
jgi:hypothetical protein